MKYLLVFINILLLPLLIHCQSISFQRITVDDGLSNNFVRSIHKDQFGFIWFGTLDGLDRFDGVEIRSFSEKFPTGVQRVNSIIDIPGNGLWVGTEKGLFFWDFIAHAFKLIPVSAHQLNVTTLLALPGDSLLMAGTSGGIYLINTATFELSELEVNIDIPYIPSKAVYDGRGNVWIATSVCLIEVDLEDFSTQIHFNGQTESANSNFSTLTVMNDNILLGTMTRGLFLYNSSEKEFTPYRNIGTNFILAAHFTPQGNLYIGTDGKGFIEINTNDGTMRSFAQDLSNPHSINSNAVYSILALNTGRLWLGTYSGGINYTSAENNFFYGYSAEDFYLGANSIRSIYFDAEGYTFIGTREGLYVIDQAGKSQLFHIENSAFLRSNVILSFGALEKDVLVGTFRGGLSKYNRRRNKLEDFIDFAPFSYGSIYKIAHDKDGNILIADIAGLIFIQSQTGMVRQFNPTWAFYQ